MVLAPRRGDYRWALRLAVRWDDMDSLGHVNNARYMTYAEAARLAYFEPLMGEEPGSRNLGLGMILASISCDFLQQLRYPADIVVGTRVTHVGRSSLTMEQTVFEGERAVANLRAVMVWFDYAAQKAVPIPDRARAYIAEREGAVAAADRGASPEGA
ncbi:MAG: acyl-CoA thioesterase [Nevskiaceae bacterium]|nr:MAG: acyl-CoA thioesterase [Nevskiaceae bacterium]TBR71512.1 MAG: acyl-CoA thioesterase [Nevskiaceae bacterium]